MAKLLVMEDNEAQALAWATVLENAGHDVRLFDSGTDALGAILEEPFDLLITDLLVKKDGRFVADGGLLLISRVRLRAGDRDRPWLNGLPILAISGGVVVPGGYDPLFIAGNAGADKLLRKPNASDDLLKEVTLLLPGAAAEERAHGGD